MTTRPHCGVHTLLRSDATPGIRLTRLRHAALDVGAVLKDGGGECCIGHPPCECHRVPESSQCGPLALPRRHIIGSPATADHCSCPMKPHNISWPRYVRF